MKLKLFDGFCKKFQSPLITAFLFLGLICKGYSQGVGPSGNKVKLYLTPGLVVDQAMTSFTKNNGIQIAELIGQADIDPNNIGIPNFSLLEKRIIEIFPNRLSRGICILDWEGLASNILDDPQSLKYNAEVKEFIKTIKFVKELRPKVQWGFYGLPPRSYWDLGPKWLEKCEKLKPLLSKCDIIFPSVYLFYPSSPTIKILNKEYIESNVDIALKIGIDLNKPVMPVITHRLPDLKLIPYDNFQSYISNILLTEYNGKHASGIIFWGADLYEYQTNKSFIRNEPPTKDEFLKYNDTLLIHYCKAIQQM